MKRGRWVRSEHECNLPAAGNRAVGSIWQCRCGQQWRLVSKWHDLMIERTRWDPIDDERGTR